MGQLWAAAVAIGGSLTCAAEGLNGGLEKTDPPPVRSCKKLEECFPGTVSWPGTMGYTTENHSMCIYLETYLTLAGDKVY